MRSCLVCCAVPFIKLFNSLAWITVPLDKWLWELISLSNSSYTVCILPPHLCRSYSMYKQYPLLPTVRSHLYMNLLWITNSFPCSLYTKFKDMMMMRITDNFELGKFLDVLHFIVTLLQKSYHFSSRWGWCLFGVR